MCNDGGHHFSSSAFLNPPALFWSHLHLQPYKEVFTADRGWINLCSVSNLKLFHELCLYSFALLCNESSWLVLISHPYQIKDVFHVLWPDWRWRYCKCDVCVYISEVFICIEPWLYHNLKLHLVWHLYVIVCFCYTFVYWEVFWVELFNILHC